MSDKYVCTLDAKSLKKAKEELNEDPKERMGAVETLRKWILEQKHLTCPTDTLFLLSFLRARKFSQLEARALLEKYLTMKTKHKEWFDDLDPLDPKIQAILKDGYWFTATKPNAEGQIVFFANIAKLQPWSGRYTKLDIFRASICATYHLFIMNESAQVNGIVAFQDLTGMTMKHQTMFSLDDQKSFFSGWHRSIPARMKKLLLYNLGAFGEFIVSFMRFILPDTLQDRLLSCGSNLENVYKEIPKECLPVEYLPDDYKGPNQGTINQLIEKYIADISSPESCARIRHLSSSKFRISEAKRVNDVPAASFRKLNID